MNSKQSMRRSAADDVVGFEYEDSAESDLDDDDDSSSEEEKTGYTNA